MTQQLAPKKIQEWIDAWKELEIEKYRLGVQEKELIEKITLACPDPLQDSSKQVFLGEEEELSVKPRINVNYKKDRGSPHPLLILAEEYPNLEPMIRVSCSESGQKIETYLEQAPEEDECAIAIRSVRSKNVGKPEIKVKKLDDFA